MPAKKTATVKRKATPSKQKPAKAPQKRWPEIYDLLAWWIWYNLVKNTVYANPHTLDAWIGDIFKTASNHHNIHRTLYKEFKGFRDEFEPPVMIRKQSKKRKTK